MHPAANAWPQRWLASSRCSAHWNQRGHCRAGTADGEVARRYRVLPTPPTIPRGRQPPSAKLSGSWHCMQGEHPSGAMQANTHCKHTLPGYNGGLIGTISQPALQCYWCSCITSTPGCWPLVARCRCMSAARMCTKCLSAAHPKFGCTRMCTVGLPCTQYDCLRSMSSSAWGWTLPCCWPHRVIGHTVHKPRNKARVAVCALAAPCRPHVLTTHQHPRVMAQCERSAADTRCHVRRRTCASNCRIQNQPEWVAAGLRTPCSAVHG